MTTERPPSIDPAAAARWAQRVPAQSPWLHEEVARRMEERLQWIVQKPARWVHWEPARGGLQAHGLLTKRYPKSECFVLEAPVKHAQAAHKLIAPAWWNPARWAGPKMTFSEPAEPVNMLWANMALHMAADPQALIQRWNQLIATDGFLMFSCLGPDTLREVRQVYAGLGWGTPTHDFTDMHDWGDMLVRAGFAEPVMDMERITLSYSSADNLLAELRELGRNLHAHRFPALRGRHWRSKLCQALESALCKSDGRLELTFEVVYGHAFKPVPRVAIQAESRVSLTQLKSMLSKKN